MKLTSLESGIEKILKSLEGSKLFKAKIFITLKPAVLDPQGKAIDNSLAALEYSTVNGARVGKYIELNVNVTDKNQADKLVTEVCEKILVNLVIEDYRYELVGVSS